jgi:tRNA(Arg) A34 adenosine deaminase TadA
MCYGAISRARIVKIYYGNTEKDAADIGFDDSAFQKDIKKDFTQRDIPVEQLLHNEALEVFKAWKNKKDKIAY